MSPLSPASRLTIRYSGKASSGDVVVVVVVVVVATSTSSPPSLVARVVIGAASVVVVVVSSPSASPEQAASSAKAKPTRIACLKLTIPLYIGRRLARLSRCPASPRSRFHPSIARN